MRMPLKDMPARPGYTAEDLPFRIWNVSGPEWGGKICAVHHFAKGADATPALRKFPDGLCPVPHWGYCFKGQATVRYGDGSEEVLRAGDIFYWPAGHTFFTERDAKEGCELIEFTEVADFKAMEAGLKQAGK
jgi:hypothetical protein